MAVLMQAFLFVFALQIMAEPVVDSSMGWLLPVWVSCWSVP